MPAPFSAPTLHLLIDHYGGTGLDDPNHLQEALLGAAAAAGAHVLSCEMRHFGGAGGVTGVVLLRESHMSIHSWPEHGLAAIDIFMCGSADPHSAADHLATTLRPERVEITEVARGQRNQRSQPSR